MGEILFSLFHQLLPSLTKDLTCFTKYGFYFFTCGFSCASFILFLIMILEHVLSSSFMPFFFFMRLSLNLESDNTVHKPTI